MLRLIYDTETTGLPLDYKAHVHDVDNWPRMVQLAWGVYDDDMSPLSMRNHIINPYFSYEIPASASLVHGITDEKANEEGEDIMLVLAEFQVAQQLCNLQIGHNVNFDRKVIGAEFIRAGMEAGYQLGKDMERYCTMFKTTEMCGLRHASGRGGNKWPNLQELHAHLFGEGFKEGHNAMVDVEATARCYKELLFIGEAGAK